MENLICPNISEIELGEVGSLTVDINKCDEDYCDGIYIVVSVISAILDVNTSTFVY